MWLCLTSSASVSFGNNLVQSNCIGSTGTRSSGGPPLGSGSTEVVTQAQQTIAIPAPRSTSPEALVFSDTVVYVSRGDSFLDLTEVVRASSQLLGFGFSGAQCPLRGAIGHGDVVSEDGVLLGAAVEDAYRACESQVWSGCVLTDDTEQFAAAQGTLHRGAATSLPSRNATR